jgi:hypothetical protein
MASDDSPLSSTVTETVTTTVDTGADKETIESVNSAFDDFWKDEDSKTEAPPAAPGDDEARETKESKPEPTILDSAPEKPKEYSDEEIDHFALTKSDRPEAIANFRQLKEGWKAERARAKAESERANKLEQELAEARKNSWTPETKADYEHAVSVRRKFDFASDPEFQARFQIPLTQNFHALLNEVVDALPVSREEAQDWAQKIISRYSLDSPELDKTWWNHSVLDKIPDETERASVRQGLANLLRMQKERDLEISRRSNDQSAYDNWIKERDLLKSQREQREVMEEIGVQEQKLKEVFKKDPAQAKTKEEREAIEVHNERYERLNGHFQETMQDLMANGAKAKVRAAVDATRALYMEGEYRKLEQDYKATKAERDQLRAELDKITGARRKISHTTGTPPTTSGKDKNGQGLTLKGLDVRDAFKNFDWKDGS